MAVEGEGEARGGGGWRSGGAGWRVVGGADAEDVCPSRRTIIEVSDSRTFVGYMDKYDSKVRHTLVPPFFVGVCVGQERTIRGLFCFLPR